MTKATKGREGLRLIISFTILFWGTVGVTAALFITNYMEKQ
jgi:hypothetical protein